MISIDLADRLEVRPAPALELSCEGLPVTQSESNLVIRAARALAERLGRPASARIRLTKRIPIGAGLGGGSSDAAVALLLLSRLWESELAEADLLDVASRLGSDVPFLLVGGQAEVSGRGEQVAAREDEAEEDLLLLVPPFSLSTREVYAALDRLRPKAPPLPDRLAVDDSGNFFGPNDLASAVLAISPQMEAYVNSARNLAAEVGITGSGSTIVLRGATREAVVKLESLHPGTKLQRARTLGRQEHRRRTTLDPGGSTWRSLR